MTGTTSEPPVGTAKGLLYFTDGSLAYAGHYFHEDSHPVHTHSFVEIAVVTGGEGVHKSLAGSKELQVGDVILLRPGVWHGYEDCRRLDLFDCCFSNELLRRELAWTREDPLLVLPAVDGPQLDAAARHADHAAGCTSTQRVRDSPRRARPPQGRPRRAAPRRHHRPAVAVPQPPRQGGRRGAGH
ncbi:AraC family ligand binding domain-containing protein, partial [Actinomadura adrarensis]